MKHLASSYATFFKYSELTEIVMQNDKLFIDLLSKDWVHNIDNDVETLLKANFIYESDKNYQKDALYMYADKKPVVKKKESVLNNLPGDRPTKKSRIIYSLEQKEVLYQKMRLQLVCIMWDHFQNIQLIY